MIFCSLPVPRSFGVDIEGHLDLRHPARRGGKPDEVKYPEGLVVPSHLALALEDLDLDRGLVVRRRREGFALLGWNGRVPLDQLRAHPAERLDAEGERRHVEQQKVLDVAREDAALDRRADRHHLVGVDPLVRLLPEELLDELLDSRHPGLTADQDDLVDVLGLHARVLERLFARTRRAVDDVFDELLELGSRELQLEMLRARRVRRDERQVDFGLDHVRELDLGLLRRFLQALHRHRVLGEVDALILLELREDPVDDPLVDVVAAQVRVAVGRLDLDDSLPDLEDRDVEGAAAEVIDGDGLVLLLVEAVGESRGCGLVDEPLDRQPGDLAGVLRGLPLGVVEVGGHRDHGARHLLAEIRLGGFLQFAEDHGADLGRRVLLAARLDAHVSVPRGRHREGHHLHLLGHFRKLPAHEPLDRKDGVGGVGDCLPFRNLADEALPALGERDDGGGGSIPLCVGDDDGVPTLHHGHARVRGAEVDSDDLAHFSSLLPFPRFGPRSSRVEGAS